MAVVTNKLLKRTRNGYKFNPLKFEGRNRPAMFTTRDILCCARCKIPLRQVYGKARYTQECPVCGKGSAGFVVSRAHILPVFGGKRV